MKALVTGGAGFLGRYLVRELVNQGIETVVYDKGLSGEIKEPDFPNDISFFSGDILDSNQLTAAMDGCDLVFHTAAIADIEETRNKPIQTMEVNVGGTVRCLEAARINGVKRFLFASSVYTSGNKGSFYRVSKQAGESLCKTYHEEYGLEFTILKYGSLYGRGANHWNFMYTVCKNLLLNGEYTYDGSPDAIREYIHVADVARETVRIAQDPNFRSKTVLITGHQRMKMKDVFDTIQEILDNKVNIHYLPNDQQRHYVRTPYSFDTDIPVRINPSEYVDITEGILDCLKEVEYNLQMEKKEEWY